jgi:membrane-associated phospholipid phosphatase
LTGAIAMNPTERLFTFLTKPWVMLSYVSLIFLSYFYIDQPLALWIASLNLKNFLVYIKAITIFGTYEFYLVALLGLAIFFQYGYRQQLWGNRFWFLWLCVLISNLICGILKVLVGRARPELLFKSHEYGFYGFQHHASYWSFPSGHTITIMSLVFALSILFPVYGWLYIMTGFVIACSRILLAKHYLSDVLVAMYLALVNVHVLYIRFFKK